MNNQDQTRARIIFTVHEWERMIFTVHEQERIIFKVHEWERMIFTVHEWERIIFKVHGQEQMILLYTQFQDLIINYQEVTLKWLIINWKYHSWPLMNDIHFPVLNTLAYCGSWR